MYGISDYADTGMLNDIWSISITTVFRIGEKAFNLRVLRLQDARICS